MFERVVFKCMTRGDAHPQVIRGGIRRLRAFGVVSERLEVLEVKRLTEILVEVELVSPWRLLVWEAPKRCVGACDKVS